MRIIITTDTKKEIVEKMDFEDVKDKVTYDDLVSIFLLLLESITTQFISETEVGQEGKEYLYDMLDTLFYTFMQRTFPTVQPREFDLTDAALIFAQDQIIELADKEGISFQQAVKKYETKARKYVKQKGNKYA